MAVNLFISNSNLEMKNQFFKNIFNIAIFILLIISMDYFIGNLCRKYYFKQTKGEIFKTNYSIDSVKTDILIFGSSRANHHYIPDIFEDSLLLSCYNTGIDGRFIFYNYGLLQCVLSRYTPKIAILDLTPNDVLVSSDAYDRLDVLLPFYKTHKEVVPLLNMRKNEKIKMLSQIYPFNHCLFSFEKINPQDIPLELRTKCFRRENSKWSQEKKKEVEYELKFDKNKIEIFYKFMDVCKLKGITLIVVVSPFYLDLSNSSKKLIKIIRSMTIERNVSFYDFSQDTTFINHSGLFLDQIHLNPYGAEILSNDLIKKIRLSNLISISN